MVQRFYFTGSGTTPGPTPAQWGGWTGAFVQRRPLLLAKTNSANVANNQTNTINTQINLIGTRQFICMTPLKGQTLAGATMSMVVKAAESVADCDASLQAVLRTIDPTTFAQKQVLYGGHSAALNATVGALGEELPVTAATRILNAVPLANVTIDPGDLLVFEPGTRNLQTTTNSRTLGLTFGDPTSGDFALTSGLTTTLAPWMEISVDMFATVTESFMPGLRA